MAVNEQVIIELVARTEAAEKQIAALTEQLNKTKTAAKQASQDGLERLTKNGGAMAILNDLTGGLAMQFKDAYESIQLTNTGLKGMRAALIATGIGAAVVAVGLLVEHFDDIQEFFRDKSREDALKKENELIASTTTSLREQAELLKAAGATREEIFVIEEQILQNTIRQKDNEIEMATILGNEEDKLKLIEEKRQAILAVQVLQTAEEKRRADIIDQARQNVDAEYKAKQDQAKIAKDEKELLADIERRRKNLLDFELSVQQKLARYPKESKQYKEEEAFYSEQLNSDRAELLKLEQEYNLLTASITKQEDDAAKKADDKLKTQTKITEEKKKQAFIEEEAEDEEPEVGFTLEQQIDLANFKAVRDEKVKMEEEFNAQMDAIQAQQMADDARRNEAMEQGRKMMDDLRIQGAFATLSTIADLSELFAGESEKSQRKAFAVNKAASIATATAQTYLSAVAAYNSQLVPLDPTSPVRASIAAGIAIASGLVNVAKISATKFGGGPSGGGGSTPSIPGGGGAPTPTNPQAALDFSFLNQQQPVQTYVIAGDVTNAQEANQKLKDQSAL